MKIFWIYSTTLFSFQKEISFVKLQVTHVSEVLTSLTLNLTNFFMNQMKYVQIRLSRIVFYSNRQIIMYYLLSSCIQKILGTFFYWFWIRNIQPDIASKLNLKIRLSEHLINNKLLLKFYVFNMKKKRIFLLLIVKLISKYIKLVCLHIWII